MPGKRLPAWIRVRLPSGPVAARTGEILARHGLRTVCQDARCPNAGECWSHGTATFLILGGTCTGTCRFCSVAKGRPAPADPTEPERVAQGVKELGLTHTVITSVTRADLPDGGAGHFASVVRAIRTACPRTTVEILIPDFAGSPAALDAALDSRPDILGHNMETVPRLYTLMRPRADYARSLGVLRQAASRGGSIVKSALLLGLGEEMTEVESTMADILKTGCSFLMLGQYLRPGPECAPVARYLDPSEFAELKTRAIGMGFSRVESSPLSRSSYHAEMK